MPKYLLWLFKPDCVDLVWYLAAKLSIQRPEYLSSECGDLDSEFDPVTSYRILISVVVVFLGSLKTTSAYGSFFTDTIWLEWLFGGLVSSVCVNFNLAQVNQIMKIRH